MLAELVNAEKKMLAEARVSTEDLAAALRENRHLDLLCTRLYPDLSRFRGRVPTYYRIDTAKASRYHLPGNRNGVIVFLKKELQTREAFVDYFGCDLPQFLDLVAEDLVIPMMDRVEGERDAWGPYATGVYRELFDAWERDARLDGRFPLYANALHEALRGSKPARDHAREFERMRRLAASVVDFERIDRALGRPTPRTGLGSQPAARYFAERCAMLDLLGAREFAQDLADAVARYELSGREKDLALAADYAFTTHQFVTGPVFYSKGFGCTVSKADLLAARDTLRQVRETAHERGRSVERLRLRLANVVARIGRGASKTPVPEVAIPRGRSPAEERALHARTRADEELGAALLDATRLQQRQHEALLGKRDVLDAFGELEATLRNLSRHYYERYEARWDLLNTGLCFGLSFAPGPVAQFASLADGHEEGLVEAGRERVVGTYAFAVSCWKEGDPDPVSALRLFDDG